MNPNELTTKEEAFTHNSCKKLAQLVKVITFMDGTQLDRQNEKADVTRQYEMEVKRCFADAVKQYNEMQVALIKYRKLCIDKSCGQYGTMYKQMKAQYAEYVNAQKMRIAKVGEELRQTEMEIKTLVESAESMTRSVVLDADAVLNAANGRSSRLTNSEISIATKEWDDKAKQVLVDFEQTMKTLKTTHSKQTRQIKNEINRIFKSIALERKSEFQESFDSIDQLKKDCSTLRKKLLSEIKLHRKVSEMSAAQKDGIYDRTKKECDVISKQYNESLARGKSESTARTKELTELAEKFGETAAAHRALLDRYQRHIDDKVKKIERIQMNKDSNLSKTKDAAESVHLEMLQDTEKEFGMLKKFYAKKQRQIIDEEQKLIDLMTLNKITTEQGIECIKAKMGEMQAAAARFKEAREQNAGVELDQVNRQVDDRVAEIEEQIKVLSASGKGVSVMQNKVNDDLKAELEKLKADNEKMLEARRQEDDAVINQFTEKEQERVSKKEKEIEEMFAKRILEREKKQEELEAKFSQELTEKKAAIQTDLESKLEEVCFLGDDREAHRQYETQRNKLAGTLEFATRKIEQTKREEQAQTQKLQNEASSAEKAQRQLMRRIETETRQIDDDFEMKIQVEQVSLREKIENIAKLYNADENTRAVEVIDMVRKVRETRNRVDDFLRRKNNEVKDLRKANQREEQSLINQIAMFKNRDRETQVKEELAALQVLLKEEIAEIRSNQETQIAQIDKEIVQIKENTAKQIAQIETSKRASIASIEKSVAQTESQIIEAEKSAQPKKESLAREAESKQKDMESKHNIDKEKLMNRIQFAKTRQSEMIAQHAKAESEIVENLRISMVKVAESYFNSMAHLRAQSEEQMKSLQRKWQQVSDAQFLLEDGDAEMPTTIRTLITDLNAEITELDEKLGDMQQKTVSLFLNGPTITEDDIRARSIETPKAERASSRQILPPLV